MGSVTDLRHQGSWTEKVWEPSEPESETYLQLKINLESAPHPHQAFHDWITGSSSFRSQCERHPDGKVKWLRTQALLILPIWNSRAIMKLCSNSSLPQAHSLLFHSRTIWNWTQHASSQQEYRAWVIHPDWQLNLLQAITEIQLLPPHSERPPGPWF